MVSQTDDSPETIEVSLASLLRRLAGMTYVDIESALHNCLRLIVRWKGGLSLLFGELTDGTLLSLATWSEKHL